MIKCPNPDCGFENVDGTQFCEACGEELPQGGTAADPGDGTGLVKCPACGELNSSENVACEACGAELESGAMPATGPAAVDAEAAVVPSVEPDPVAVPVAEPASSLPTGNLAPGLLKLVVEQGQTVGAQFVLGDAELLVGREDEEEGIYPDIDLSDQDAGYVHRRHAIIRFDNGNLTVEHLGGSNKTRINNKPIDDNSPQAVKPGDKIAFGKVVLRLLPV